MEWLNNFLYSTSESGQIFLNFLGSLSIAVFLWLIRMMILSYIDRQIDDVDYRLQWRKMSTYLFVILGSVLIGRIWIASVQSMITFLGLVSAGVAIALQRPLTNLAGWIFIFTRHPFKIGDRIEIGDHAGDVIDIRVFQFIILEIGNWVDADQSTGRIIHIPNEKVFTEALANYGEGFSYIWHEIPVVITFESNWEKAKSMLQNIVDKYAKNIDQRVAQQVREANRELPIRYTKLTPAVYTRVERSGVLLTIRYLCEVRRRRASEQEIWEKILKNFAQHSDIEFAYPTQRLYYK